MTAPSEAWEPKRGDSVRVTSGSHKGKTGTFDAFSQMTASGYVRFPDGISANIWLRHLEPAGATEVTAEEYPEKIESDGPWEVTARIIDGPLKGRTGSLLGPNNILSEKFDDPIVNLQLDDGSLQAVALRTVEFVPLDEMSSGDE